MIILLPLTALIVLAADPIAGFLIPANPNVSCARADMVHSTSTMLVVFAPQVMLYGLSVVLFGLLQAYRRFTGPALAPVIANVVMISSYLVFASLDKGVPLASTPLAAELVLASGTPLSSDANNRYELIITTLAITGASAGPVNLRYACSSPNRTTERP